MVDARTPQDTHVYGEGTRSDVLRPTNTEVVVEQETEEELVPHAPDDAADAEPQVQQEPVPWFSREPVLVMGAVQTALALAMGFGLDIDLVQMGLIMAFVAAVLSLITRQQVTPFVPAGTTPNVSNANNTPLVG